ncbi:MAG: LemA family protein [Alphaproteobacteria bacterium]
MLEITGIIALIALIGGYIWYVSIISRRNKAQEAFSGIDVQLKKRHDLIPNILKVARRFMEHEKGLLEEVTRLRAQAVEKEGTRAAEAGEKFEIERQLQAGLGRLMVAVENYPDLKSDRHMLEAQRSLNEVEANIAASRRFYNASVTSLRNAIQIFPGTMIANMAGVENMPLFEAAGEERQFVDADAYLS